MHRGARIAILALTLTLTCLVAQPAAADSPPLPDSMAALGDSIPRAYDVCCSYGDHPGQSWSTGSTWYDGITSHGERIRRLHPAIGGHAWNDAVSGAKMAAGPTQAGPAADQGGQDVTILLGANDVCTSSPDTMTPPDTFRSEFEATMDTLTQRLPAARIFVSSIPDIHRLWEVLHTNSIARTAGAAAHLCQRMLGATRTEEQRQGVVARRE